MDRAPLRSFIESAADALTRARGTLLLLTQGGTTVDLQAVAATVNDIALVAGEMQLSAVAQNAKVCSAAILAVGDSSERAYDALDKIVRVEAELLDAAVVDEFAEDLTELVDGSFDDLIHQTSSPEVSADFTIDEEVLEIFRGEGEELLAAISLGIDVLAASPGDQNALWDIRRCAHTFKGAAGIVGLNEAASLAHRMEDLLDRLVESNSPSSREVTEFLHGCVRSLGGVLDGAPANSAGLELAYSGAAASLSSATKVEAASSNSAEPKASGQKPTVRVSLDRLNEILSLAQDLLRTADPTQRALAEDIHDKLVRIRLVRFGTLETRFARAVANTAQEEGKRAVLEIQTPDVEIDTLIVDALVEPLIHLLKNAIVHGIEVPEMRRLVGKHEFGLISIRVDADSDAIIITVSDDGAGISTSKLKQKAVSKGLLTGDAADSMSEREAQRLLFDKGLTTADKVDLNAGRGIGMGIVKESIESRGGSVHVESTPQMGTTFTLILPVNVIAPPEPNPPPSRVNAPVASGSPLVMVVDDSASIRRHNQRIIENAGMRCITAEHGADALEILLNGSILPDLIISDVEMPHIDGWQLLEYIRTDDHLSELPVILVTSLNSPKHRAKAEELGATNYIVKPLTGDHLSLIAAVIQNDPA